MIDILKNNIVEAFRHNLCPSTNLARLLSHNEENHNRQGFENK